MTSDEIEAWDEFSKFWKWTLTEPGDYERCKAFFTAGWQAARDAAAPTEGETP